MPVQAQPAGYHSVTSYLYIKDAAAAIEFYQQAFGAIELMRLPGPGGSVMHAEIKIGDSPVMLADEFPEMGTLGPQSRGGATSGLMIYTPDCDALFNRAVAAGATVVRPLADQFYGDRSGTVCDPYGHVWTLATHVEDVPQHEIDRRFAEWQSQQQ